MSSSPPSWRKNKDKSKSTGWAAFDLKHRHHHGGGGAAGFDPEFHPTNDPFPTLPNPKIPKSTPPLLHSFSCNNNNNNCHHHRCHLLKLTNCNDLRKAPLYPALDPNPNPDPDPERSFSPSPLCPHSLTEENRHCKNPLPASRCSCGGGIEEDSSGEVVRFQTLTRLKGSHGWADVSLIEDIMASVDNDIVRASTLLTEMASCPNSQEHDPSAIAGAKFDFPYRSLSSPGKVVFLGEATDPLKGCLGPNEGAVFADERNAAEILPENATELHSKISLGWLSSIPIEPEWEEDDLYLNHRRDAIKMMRAASQHSKAATIAFLRGNHFSAQQLSRKAQEEWMAAEWLNAKAAKEILSIRNKKNDLWMLDLHGLHAAEAVQALQEHLQKIEICFPLNRAFSPNGVKSSTGIPHSLPSKSVNLMDSEKTDRQQALFKERPDLLQVITGIGNHSRGQASLPMAVASFLDENGYRFEETRPGVISIRPKFRHR